MSQRKSTLNLLGSFHLVCSGKTVLLGRERQEELLAYLALHAGEPVSRRQIAFTFWPDSNEGQAFTNLRKALHGLRGKLPGWHETVHTSRQHLQWQTAAPYQVDVAEFEAVVESALQLSPAARDWQALAQAIEAYRGDLLEGSYWEWVVPLRERLRHHYLTSLEELIDQMEKRGSFREALGYAERIVSHAPLHESGYLRLMQLLLAQGDRAQALRVYHTCATELRRELGVDPGQAIQAAYREALMADETRVVPRSASVSRPRQGLQELVGRQTEWQTLVDIWREAEQTPTQVVVIAGESGIGKTHLAAEYLTWTERRGARTARARAYAAESDLGFASVCEWLRTPGVTAFRSHLAPHWLPEVARLLPELLDQFPDLEPPHPVNEGWQRQRLYTSLAHALLVSNQPLVLFLDDLQWCDGESLTWIHYLLRFATGEGRRIYPKARLILLITLRDYEIEPGDSIRNFLRQLHKVGAVTDLPLALLSEDETKTLAGNVAGQSLERAKLSRIWADSGGNPLMVVESVRALEEASHEPDSADAPRIELAIPATIYALLEERLARVSSAAGELVSLAAVIGRAFDFSILAAASTLSGDEVLVALEELWKRQLIVEAGSDAYDFSHDRLRDVAYAQLSRPRRYYLHRRVAQVLLGLDRIGDDERDGRVAGHFERAGLAQEAVHHYLLAGERALDGWHSEQAYAYLNRAVELASTREDLVRGLYGRARAFFLRDQRSVALEDIARGLTLLDGADHRLVPPLLYLRADILIADDQEAAESTLRTALAAAERLGDLTTVGQSLSLLGQIHTHRGELDKERPLIDRALTIAQSEGDHWRVARTQADLAFLLTQMGLFASAIAPAQEAMAMLETTPDRGGIAFVWNILGRAYGGIGQFDEAFAAFVHCRQVADEIGLNSMALQIPNMFGWLHHQLGDYRGALRLNQSGLEIALQEGATNPEISARLNICHNQLALEGPEAASADLTSIERRLSQGDYGYHSWRWRIRLIYLKALGYLHGQAPQQVLALVADGAAMAAQTSARKYGVLFHEIRGAALAMECDLPGAQQALTEAVQQADRIVCRPVGLRARRLLAWIQCEMGDEAGSIAAAQEADAIQDIIARSIEDPTLRRIFLETSNRYERGLPISILI